MFQEIQGLVMQYVPKIGNVGENSDVLGSDQTFPPEVEEEANAYYEKIYTGDLTILQVIELLQRYKNSKNEHEQNVFSCMVHNLFDEYRFFPKYPDKELIVTGELFGALIQHQLVSYIPLGVALRYVLEALGKPLGTKMFRFGLTALLQFQGRLTEWPQYCSHILQISHVKEAHPEIIRVVNTAFANSAGVNAASPDMQLRLDESVDIQTGSVAPLNAESLVLPGGDQKFEVPNDVTREKILFLVNNMSEDNIKIKLPDLQAVLKEVYFRWFSNYLVVKRASIEPNYHVLYVKLVDAINNKTLTKDVVGETLSNIRTLLSAEKTATSSQERTLLKNLGAWLGKITLAKDLPIRHKDLAVKVRTLYDIDYSDW